MFIPRIVGVFVLVSFIGGCAKMPAKDSPPQMTSDAKNETIAAIKSAAKIDRKTEVIEQIMVESGLDHSIEQLPSQVAVGFDQQPSPPIDNNKRNKFREHLVQAYDATKMKNEIRGYLIANYDHKKFPEFLALLKTPLAQKLTALEKEAQTPEAQQDMMQRGNIIMSQVTPERLDLVRQLEEATKATESGLIVQMMMTAVTMNNLNKIVPTAQKITQEQIKQNLGQIRAQSVYPMRQYMHLLMVYAYNSVNDGELQQYVTLSKSDVGQWSIDLLNNAMINASEGVANDLAMRLEKEFVVSNAL